MYFFQFCGDLNTKSKSIKAIYINACERSRCTLSENGIVYYAMTYCFKDIRAWCQTNLINFYWVSIFFYILIANISWMLSWTPIIHISFWKSITRTFRCIYVNCFSRLRFLAEVSTKLKKIHFLGQFKNCNL